MGRVTSDKYENLHLDAEEVPFIRDMAWIWGTYGALCQHDMVESFRDNPTAFRRVVQHHGTTLAMEYFKVCEVKVLKRG